MALSLFEEKRSNEDRRKLEALWNVASGNESYQKYCINKYWLSENEHEERRKRMPKRNIWSQWNNQYWNSKAWKPKMLENAKMAAKAIMAKCQWRNEMMYYNEEMHIKYCEKSGENLSGEIAAAAAKRKCLKIGGLRKAGGWWLAALAGWRKLAASAFNPKSTAGESDDQSDSRERREEKIHMASEEKSAPDETEEISFWERREMWKYEKRNIVCNEELKKLQWLI